ARRRAGGWQQKLTNRTRSTPHPRKRSRRDATGGGGEERTGLGYLEDNPMSTRNSTTHIDLRTAANRIAGKYNPANRTFTKTFLDNHVLQKPRALALDVDILKQLAALGCETLVFRHRLTGETRVASLAHFLEKSFEFDRGFGRQRALPLAAFIQETRGPKRSSAPAEPAQVEKPKPAQLNLWSLK
ncbi:MAG: hypothetical protein ACKOC5_19450, partial [Chloroflexota bacterium]